MVNERYKGIAEHARGVEDVVERARYTASNLRNLGASKTADALDELADNEEKRDSQNKHWTCKDCFGNNGDEDIDDFGICKGCRDKKVDK